MTKDKAMVWIGSAYNDLLAFPELARRVDLVRSAVHVGASAALT